MHTKIRKTAPAAVASLVLSAAAAGVVHQATPGMPQFARTAARDHALAARLDRLPVTGSPRVRNRSFSR